jgi:hypothetical protein
LPLPVGAALSRLFSPCGDIPGIFSGPPLNQTQNRKHNMTTKQKESIMRHGQSLLAAFPNATERDPVKLCKKLRRIETKAHQFTTDYCNGVVQSDDDMDSYTRAGLPVPGPEAFLGKVRSILGITNVEAEACGLFVNRDPRGYALKLSDDWTRDHNSKAECRIYSDWGGYGILAPEIGMEGV